MTPTDVRVRRPFFVPSRSCVCVSVGMCFERTLLPHQHAIAATFYVCVIVLIYFAQLPQCAWRWVF